MHAIVLLAHFHSLSSFVFSCGVNEELDNAMGHHYKENIQANSNVPKPIVDIQLASSPKRIPNGIDKDGKFLFFFLILNIFYAIIRGIYNNEFIRPDSL